MNDLARKKYEVPGMATCAGENCRNGGVTNLYSDDTLVLGDKVYCSTCRPVYCTSFCNFGHRLDTGRPVGHECYILDPKKLQAEARGESVEGRMVKEPVQVVKGRAS